MIVVKVAGCAQRNWTSGRICEKAKDSKGWRTREKRTVTPLDYNRTSDQGTMPYQSRDRRLLQNLGARAGAAGQLDR